MKFLMKSIKSIFTISALIRNKGYNYNEKFYNLPFLPQLKGSYSFFDYDKKNDPLHYGSKYRKKWKAQYFPHGVVEDHHIIPRQFKNHELIKKINFDLSCSNNIICMHSLVCHFFLKDNLILYHQPHSKYNKYVESVLDNIYDEWKNKILYNEYNDLYNTDELNTDELKYNFWLFHKNIEERIINYDKTIPWN